MSARPRPYSPRGPPPLKAAGNFTGRRGRDRPIASRRPVGSCGAPSPTVNERDARDTPRWSKYFVVSTSPGAPLTRILSVLCTNCLVATASCSRRSSTSSTRSSAPSSTRSLAISASCECGAASIGLNSRGAAGDEAYCERTVTAINHFLKAIMTTAWRAVSCCGHDRADRTLWRARSDRGCIALYGGKNIAALSSPSAPHVRALGMLRLSSLSSPSHSRCAPPRCWARSRRGRSKVHARPRSSRALCSCVTATQSACERTRQVYTRGHRSRACAYS
mmetsp:Transcript_9825/g.23653  ORF Transcript_9825/g.23653 Transcript_9825/m.23653 type:complete len:277 (-) Transcript_9825:200-1030(-)